MSYSPVLYIEFNHTYFKNDKCRGLSLNFSRHTSELIKGLNLLLKPVNDNKWVLMVNKNDLCNCLFKSRLNRIILENNYLEINIKIKDENFYNYTDIPSDKLIEYILNPSEEVQSNYIEDLNNKNDITDIIRGASEVYNNLGSIKVSPLFISESNVVKTYTINFNTINVHWRYYLYSYNTNEERELILEDSYKLLDFKSISKHALIDNKEYQIVETEDSFPLKENYKCNIQLIEKTSSGNKLLSNFLPTPRLNSLSKEKLNNSEFNYVNIYYYY